jgi:hypothetical protein
MPSLIRSLIARAQTAPTAEEIASLQQTYATLQFRVMQIALAAPKPATQAV